MQEHKTSDLRRRDVRCSPQKKMQFTFSWTLNIAGRQKNGHSEMKGAAGDRLILFCDLQHVKASYTS